MQTITTNNQSSFSSTQMYKNVYDSKVNTKSTPINPTGNSKNYYQVLEYHSFQLTSVNSSLILNSIYFRQKRNSEYTTSLL